MLSAADRRWLFDTYKTLCLQGFDLELDIDCRILASQHFTVSTDLPTYSVVIYVSEHFNSKQHMDCTGNANCGPVVWLAAGAGARTHGNVM